MLECPNCDISVETGHISGYGTARVTVPFILGEDGKSHEADHEVATRDLMNQLSHVKIRGYDCGACGYVWEI
jgi:hypothetical protein